MVIARQSAVSGLRQTRAPPLLGRKMFFCSQAGSNLAHDKSFTSGRL